MIDEVGGGSVTATAAHPDSSATSTSGSVPSSTTSPENGTTSSNASPPTTPRTSTTTAASAPTTTTTTTTVASGHPDTGDVAGFEVIAARLGDLSLLLALADTTPLRSRGLMGVESLGELDGMVFTWEDPQSVSFWMKNTLIPLDIGYFDEDGSLFLVLSMVPCTADPCPTYPSESPIRFALEAIPGFFDDVSPGEVLTLGGTVFSP